MSIRDTKEAKRLIQSMAPEGEFLAFINPKEAQMLKDAGGSGIMTPIGIPSFVDFGTVGSQSYADSFGGPSPDTGPTSQEDSGFDTGDVNVGLRGGMPAFTTPDNDGGDDTPTLIDRILGRTTSGINTLRDRLGDRFTRTKNYLTDPSNLKNMATTALLTSLLGPVGLVLSGIGRTEQFQNFLGGLKDRPTNEPDGIMNTELRSIKPDFLLPNQKPVQLGEPPFTDINNLMADVSQKDLDLNKTRGSKMLDLDTFRDITGNPTLTQEELDAIRDGTITKPTGKFVV